MSRSMLAAVRDAVAGTADLSSVEDAPNGPVAGLEPSQTGGQSMSENEGKPGAAKTGISQADHDAAVTAAKAEGHAAGVAEANTRMSAVLGADGVKGDGARMAAALDLALKSPAMTGGDVAAYVVANVAASAGSLDPAQYEASRLSASGLAQPVAKSGKKATLSSAEIYASRRAQKQEK